MLDDDVYQELINMHGNINGQEPRIAELQPFNDQEETDYSLINEEYPPEIFHQNSMHLPQIRDDSIHLVVTSPIYNVGVDYADDPMNDLRKNYNYMRIMEDVFRETLRVLKTGGKICVNVANYGRKPYRNMMGVISSMLHDVGFDLFGEIIWLKGQSGAGSAWGSWKSESNPYVRGIHEYVILARKGNRALKKPKKSSRTTLTKEGFLRSTLSSWYLPPVGKSFHPAQYPYGLPHRLVNLFTSTDMVVADFFAGSGTTIDAAKRLGRYSIGIDVSKKYADYMKERFHVNSLRAKQRVYNEKYLNWFSSL